MKERYQRQKAFYAVGEKGQKRIREARVAIIGLGGLGTVIADKLARAGVGFLRLIDRDAVVLSALQRQTLYIEEDALQNLFKARAVAERIGKINSEILVEPQVTDFNSQNCDNLLEGIDLVMAAVDNKDTRSCINQACFRRGIPWINGAVVGNRGMTMSMLPGQTPCYLCYLGQEGQHQEENQEHGITGMIAGVIGTIQAAEALKILLKDAPVRKTALFIDVWQNSYKEKAILADPNCPVCAMKKKNVD